MTSPAGFWAAGTEGTPDNQNAGLLQKAAFASLPTPTNKAGMCAIATDGKGGNGGPPALYRSDGTATWVFEANLVSAVGALVTDASTQSINNNAWTAVNFDTEGFDSDAFHDTVTNNERMTIPTGLGGKYLIIGGLANQGDVNLEKFGLRLYKNGSAVLGEQHMEVVTLPNTAYGLTICKIEDLSAAEYIDLRVFLQGGSFTSDLIDNQHLEIWKLD